MAFLRSIYFPHKYLQLPQGTFARVKGFASAAKAPKCEESAAKAQDTKVKEPKIKMKTILIYRYNPETPEVKPHMKKYTIDPTRCGGMVLDALAYIKAKQDPSLVYRRSCRESVCGCCAINIRGVNSLACITPLEGKESVLRLYPLPHMYVLRDLVTDQSHFFDQYERIQPWLQRREENASDAASHCNTGPSSNSLTPFLQSERDRAKLDGLYECILCGCCSASCPPYWWHYDKFLGAAVLMQAYRWIIDSRDQMHEERLKKLGDYFSVYRCHTIMNCTNCCPKGLNPGRAVAQLKRMLTGMVKKEKPDM